MIPQFPSSSWTSSRAKCASVFSSSVPPRENSNTNSVTCWSKITCAVLGSSDGSSKSVDTYGFLYSFREFLNAFLCSYTPHCSSRAPQTDCKLSSASDAQQSQCTWNSDICHLLIVPMETAVKSAQTQLQGDICSHSWRDNSLKKDNRAVLSKTILLFVIYTWEEGSGLQFNVEVVGFTVKEFAQIPTLTIVARKVARPRQRKHSCRVVLGYNWSCFPLCRVSD